jgi:hypothetical protein
MCSQPRERGTPQRNLRTESVCRAFRALPREMCDARPGGFARSAPGAEAALGSEGQGAVQSSTRARSAGLRVAPAFSPAAPG